ncbi:MAG: tetD [Bacteroidetes bacterium]|jgi:AraC-like DNA-binding protein|nr:tetD [Bacteroidota bacterium]
MNTNLSEQQKYDPWELQQEVANFKITVHCCRYWMLSEWECENMSFPFWRLYHSRLGGAYASLEGKTVHLSPDKIIIIPPYTSFSTHLKGSSGNESIKGVRIKEEAEILFYQKQGMTDQMFVHFNLGYPYDQIKQDVYEISVDHITENIVREIENDRLEEPNTIGFQSNLKIVTLILFALQRFSPALWNIPETDNRILKAIRYIDKNLDKQLTNEELSTMANLAVNSFARLFRECMNNSVQQYIQQRRIDQAIILLHHSDLSIEEISSQCGFYDRHHFSRIFRKQTGFPPGSYRQRMRAN